MIFSIPLDLNNVDSFDHVHLQTKLDEYLKSIDYDPFGSYDVLRHGVMSHCCTYNKAVGALDFDIDIHENRHFQDPNNMPTYIDFDGYINSIYKGSQYKAELTELLKIALDKAGLIN